MMFDSTLSSPGNILIVDDSPDNLRVLSSTLTQYGYTVRCVTNSAMAFRSIENRSPDLILLDIRMPEPNGYDICRQLKRNAQTQEIPVIFLSALSEAEDIVEAFKVGGVDYITKPFQTAEVLARINNQLTIQNLQKQLTEQNQQLKQEIEERQKTEVALRQEIHYRIGIEAALQDAKDMVEAASYAKSEFLAKMSHELRTPLNAILGFTSLMQEDDSLSLEYQDYLDTISNSGRRLLKLINDILTLTKVDAGQLSLHEHDMDLHQLLEILATLWQARAIAKGLQFTFHRTPDVPRWICADENKLRQVLMNLLEHAIKVTPQGQVTFRVSTHDSELAAWGDSELVETSRLLSPSLPSVHPMTLLIKITDAGEGIATAKIDQWFQVLSQTGTGQKPEPGLGLLVSHQFVQVMGGSITLASAPTQGTVTTVQIPVHPAAGSLSAAPLAAPLLPSNDSTDVTIPLETLRTIMSDAWLEQLHDAAVKGFDQQILQLLRDIPASHSVLARLLVTWARNFEFDRIEQLTQQVNG